MALMKNLGKNKTITVYESSRYVYSYSISENFENLYTFTIITIFKVNFRHRLL